MLNALRTYLRAATKPRTPTKARLLFDDLEQRTVPAGFVVSGPLAGQASLVRVLDASTGAVKVQFDAYPGYRGGLNVAASDDRNGDGLPDRIVIGTKSGIGIAAVYSGTGALLQGFAPYGGTYRGPVSVAFADVNKDGVDDAVTGTAVGASLVKVFDGSSQAEVRSFQAFNGFGAGVNVGGGDINRDGFDDVIVGTASVAAAVAVYDGHTAEQIRFQVFGLMRGGVRVAGGDLDHDGGDDVIVATGPGSTPLVGVFRGSDLALLGGAQVFESSYIGGVELEIHDISGDGKDDLVVERHSGGARFRAFDDGGAHDLNDDRQSLAPEPGDDSGGRNRGSGR